MNKLPIIKEFLSFLRTTKKRWQMPTVIFLLVLCGLLVTANGSALARFVFSLF